MWVVILSIVEKSALAYSQLFEKTVFVVIMSKVGKGALAPAMQCYYLCIKIKRAPSQMRFNIYEIGEKE